MKLAIGILIFSSLIGLIYILSYSAFATHLPGSCAGYCGGASPDGCYCDEYSYKASPPDHCQDIETVCPNIAASAKGGTSWEVEGGGGTITVQSKPAGAGCDYTSSYYGGDGYCDDSSDECKPEYYKSGSYTSCNECSISHTKPEFNQWQQTYCKSSSSTIPLGTTTGKPNLKITLNVNPAKPQVTLTNKVQTNISAELIIENNGNAPANFTKGSKVFKVSSLDAVYTTSIVTKTEMGEWVLPTGVKIDSLPAGGKIHSFWEFTYEKLGPVLISVVVDPDNKIDEIDETDNTVDQLVTITTLTEGKFISCVPEKLGGLTFFNCIS